MKKVFTIMASVLVISSVVAGCGGTTEPTTTTSQPNTFGALAQSGETVFSASCSRCHGQNGGGGTGPAVIGNTTIPQIYDDASQLLSYIRTTMPQDAPGSLSTQQYQQVLAFLMVQNDFIDPGSTFDAGNLGQVPIN